MTASTAATVDHESLRSAERAARGLTSRGLPISQGWPNDHVVAVDAPLDQLLPRGGLERGQLTTVAGATSLGLALLAKASREGAWCAVAGMPSLGLAAAAEIGVSLDRLLLVAHPGDRWAEALAALVDAVDILALRLPPDFPAALLRRLISRARKRQVPLLAWSDGPVESAAAHLTARQRWHGLGEGHGHLQHRELDVTVTGRGSATRPSTTQITLDAAG